MAQPSAGLFYACIMTPLSSFYSRLIPRVPGCPEPTANQALVDAAIAFADDTLVLREQLDTFSTVAGVQKYELDPPSQQFVSRVLSVVADGRVLTVASIHDVAPLDSPSGAPMTAFMTRNGSVYELNLHPTPDKVYPVNVVVATRPARGATSLEDDLYDRWCETVISGALARIHAIPNQPFSDPAIAQQQQALFMFGANKARMEGSFNRVVSTQRVRSRPFA